LFVVNVHVVRLRKLSLIRRGFDKVEKNRTKNDSMDNYVFLVQDKPDQVLDLLSI
jgi:hypothetical protein